MNDEFQRRLARLAENNPDHGRKAPDPEPDPQRTARTGAAAFSTGKMVLFGLGVLIGLPALAIGAAALMKAPTVQTARVTEAQHKDMMELGLKVMDVVDGSGQTDEGRAAQRTLEQINLRMTFGKMTEEEFAYWQSPEGQAKYQDLTMKALNIEAARAVAQEHFAKP